MRDENAYLTVEAVLVMPMVLGVIFLVIYLLFFQYDRCLMEQSAGVLALRGCTLQVTDRSALAEELYRQFRQADAGRYLAWEAGQGGVTLKGSRVTAEQSGSLMFPFSGLMFRNGEEGMSAHVKYENHRIAPVVFIRNCRRVMGGK